MRQKIILKKKKMLESQGMAKDLVDLRKLSLKFAVGESQEAMQLNTQNSPFPQGSGIADSICV